MKKENKMSENNLILKDKLKIIICCHKQTMLPNNKDDFFLPVHVGAAISTEELALQRDDQLNGQTCDNISHKNKNYCELTALYWAWKNIKKIYPDIEYIGLNHYRRFFNFDDKFAHDWNRKLVNSVIDYKINQKKIKKILNHGYGIMAKRKIYPYSLAVDYSVAHVSDDIRSLGEIIKRSKPDYYLTFLKVFYCSNKLSHFNMFIWSYNEFDKYCTWLFEILFEAEKVINISNYNQVQSRIWGYMAERLLNVYVKKNKMKIKYFPVNVYNDTRESHIKYLLNRIRYNIAFKLSRPSFKNIK